MVRSATTIRCSVFLFGFVFLISCQFTANALASDPDVGTYGASFLQIPVGPRMLSSTEIVAGMEPDASLVFSNPAAIAGVPSGQMFITTANWLDGMQMGAASVVFPIGQSSMRIGFSTRLLYSSALKGYNDAMQVVSQESYYDLGASTALSYRFESIGLSIGASATYIREHSFPDGSGYAFSFGAHYQHARNSFHFFARDIGGEISFDGYSYPIDSRYVFGYGRSLNLPRGALNVGAQMTVTRGDTKRFRFGGEYQFNRYLILRTAVNHYFESPDNSQFPLIGGLGFRFRNMAIDYAFTPHSYFPATHMFSFSYTFAPLNAPQGETLDQNPNMAPAFPSSPAFSGENPTGAPPNPPDEKEGIAKRNAKGEAEAKNLEKTPEAVTEKVVAPVEQSKKATQKHKYTLLAGIHGRKQSAIAEVRALTLLDIPAFMEAVGSRYRVVVGRYTSKKAAQSAAKSYEGKGYRFEIIEID
ncbi:MAG: hypothetical protein GTO51_06640 [Candidatus Latescibacteria bacterium]|nr:hypothetical protein [Candidatus Latescibacterota bacterium]NIM21480.1 hypothetical protein [Candidatus Latescibacterota bacterium]NIM65651.1 hypothetical protein [Candidatus Latescibacterota bacterium]NIO02033.1 hypothetical protein [Candidatus Latescibacterota bacterium]NIO28845.1 hypothetical protein [Candidatus Latescibacterota bacterium]